MREAVVSFLRDPMWQMIGAVAAIVALAAAFFGVGGDKKSVSVTHFLQATFPEEWKLSKDFGLTYKGAPIESKNVFFDYYIIRNDSKKLPIRDREFVKKLTVFSPWEELRIISVHSCSLTHSELYTANNYSAVGKRSYVDVEWALNASSNAWSGKFGLLNPGDAACVIVVSERFGKYIEKDVFFPEWDARITAYDFLYYRNQYAYQMSIQKELSDYLYIEVMLSTGGILLFLILFCVMFYYGVKKAQSASYLADGDSVYRRLLLIALVSISTAEILADVLANREGNFFADEVHIIVWPLLAAHFMFFAYLFKKSKPPGDDF